MAIDYYKLIKGYYNDGFWTKAMVWDAVNAKYPKITQEQYTDITGDAYPEEKPIATS